MPKTLRRSQPDSAVRELQTLLSNNGYFDGQVPSDGLFDDMTHDNVILFQRQHIDQDGLPLVADGVVGPKTWWALKHPSGDAQRNRFRPQMPANLTLKREQLLELLFEEHAKPVYEVPDGSNKSQDINQYWGDTGLIALPWCCAFVSWALNEVLGFLPINGTHHVGVQKMWREARQLNKQTSQPKPGDIFIQLNASGTGHTGFVVTLSPDDNYIYTCEGNCGNRLKIGKRPKSTIHHFIDVLDDGQDLNFSRFDFDTNLVEHDPTR